MKAKHVLFFIGLAVFVSRAHGQGKPDVTNAKPNIILITVDTLRADHLSCYGYKRKTTPHLDQFASKALVFKNAFSHCSLTVPSMTSLMSGYYPHDLLTI